MIAVQLNSGNQAQHMASEDFLSETPSRPVYSTQPGVHRGLLRRLARHRQNPIRQPFAEHARQAWSQLAAKALGWHGPIIFDSFCGTGHSTAALAEQRADALIIGIDQSSARLARHPHSDSCNYLLLQTDCMQLWRLGVANGLQLAAHYLLYPNPWPKAAHLGRRIHGDSGFFALRALGGYLDLRSNWQLYVEEFGMAVIHTGGAGAVQRYIAEQPLSLFERKYLNSGHELWRFTGHWGRDDADSRIG